MNIDNLKNTIQDIVKKSCELKNKYTKEINAPVNYACIFSHNQNEYQSLLVLAGQLGKVIKETPTGPLFQITPIDTVSGKLKLLKIRQPDKTRPERGDAVFTVSNYQVFKGKYLTKPGFKHIDRPQMEMIEIIDPSFDVRTYFSHPPLDQQLGI